MRFIDIRFSSSQDTYYPGDTISGVVNIHLEKPTKCKKLNINLAWLGHGKGDAEYNIVDFQDPHDGTQLAAGQHRFPFEFRLPAGPYTYAGEYTNVTWLIQVHMDIPWARDAKEDATFLLLPGPVNHPPEPEMESAVVKDDNGFGGAIVAVVILVPSALFFLYEVFEEESIPCCGLIGLIFGLFALYHAVHRFMSTRLVGNVSMSAEPWPLHPGQTFEHTIKFTPKLEMTVNAMTVTLIGQEQSIEHHGSSSTTHSFPVFEQEIVLARDAVLPKNELAVFKAVFDLPDHAPFSFECSNHKVVWNISTHIDIPYWPDWEDSHDVQVMPDYQALGDVSVSHTDNGPERGSSW